MPLQKLGHCTESPGLSNPSVAAITHRQHASGVPSPASSHIVTLTQFTADGLLALQALDPVLQTGAVHISDPAAHPIPTSDQADSPNLRRLLDVKHTLRLKDGVLTYVP